MKNLVRCPNMCLDGSVKHYPDPSKALWELVKCPFCKGEGDVTKEEAEKIEEKL